MSKFATHPKPLLTHEGAPAWQHDAITDIYFWMLTSFVEPKFYDDGVDRVSGHIRDAIHQGLGEVLAESVIHARKVHNMRSAPVLVACEALKAGLSGEVAINMIDQVCQRADEPAEVLGYLLATGRRVPKAAKKGIERAVLRLYTERNVLKYDGHGRAIRFADVLNLTHARLGGPLGDAIQARRFGNDYVIRDLPILAADARLQDLPVEVRRAAIGGDDWIAAGWSWERAAGWCGLDASVWEALIPTMGFFALVRNLRNFTDAGISAEAQRVVIERLSDPEQVRNSRLFPYHFLSAYRAVNTNFTPSPYSTALMAAMDASLANVPTMPGRTLVLVDVSGSMSQPLSKRSVVPISDVAAVFGAAMAMSAGRTDLVAFATASERVIPTDSVMGTVMQIQGTRVGHGTDLFSAYDRYYDHHDRVIVFTDCQVMPDPEDRSPLERTWGADVPIYAWDLAGYGRTFMRPAHKRYHFAGFTDQMFNLMTAIEDLA